MNTVNQQKLKEDLEKLPSVESFTFREGGEGNIVDWICRVYLDTSILYDDKNALYEAYELLRERGITAVLDTNEYSTFWEFVL